MGLGGWVLRLCGVRLGVLRQHPPRPMVLDPVEPGALAAPLSIGLVTPVYNGERFIARTIESVLGQGYPRLSYVVKDGGSSDRTMSIVAGYAGRIDQVISARDDGQADAINQGFRALPEQVEVMGWLNGDDLLLPGALAHVSRFFAAHPEVDALYGHRILVDEADREIGRWVMPDHDDRVLTWVDYVPQESLFWRRSAWLASGGSLDASLQFAMDWDLLLRLRDSGARIARIPRFLAAFRIHDSQKTSAMSSVGVQEMRLLRIRQLGHEPSHSRVVTAVLPYLLRHVARHWRWRVFGRA